MVYKIMQSILHRRQCIFFTNGSRDGPYTASAKHWMKESKKRMSLSSICRSVRDYITLVFLVLHHVQVTNSSFLYFYQAHKIKVDCKFPSSFLRQSFFFSKLPSLLCGLQRDKKNIPYHRKATCPSLLFSLCCPPPCSVLSNLIQLSNPKLKDE
jgi:hypothetical protein